jgi:hypothetical protein
MDWIKRNLVFVIGAAVALILLGAAGWYSYSGWQNSSGQSDKLTEGYTELKRLKGLNPSPGDDDAGGKKGVNNIELAKEQQKEAREFLTKLSTKLKPIPALPDGTNFGPNDYSAALQDTISYLQRDATNNSVILPPKYKFSFEKQAGLVKFADGTLPALAVQLGEVKVISEILNEAKINSLEAIRRERVAGSPDDMSGTPSDYIDLTSTTNELAVITPYEVTFRCFTPELSKVLEGFAKSPHGLLVKAINSEPAQNQISMDPSVAAVAPVYYQQPVAAPPAAYQNRLGPMGEEGAAMARRYGGAAGGFNNPYARTAPPVAPVVAQPGVVPAAPKGPQAFIQEKQLRITLLIHVVKLLPPTQ